MSSFPRSLMSLADLTPKQINEVVSLARRLKHASARVLPPNTPLLRDMAWTQAVTDKTALSAPPQSLRNMSIALLFSKRSTRTRVAAETASKLLGGQAVFLGADDIQLGVNESARDTARVLSGMCQGIFARVGEHSEIEELAKYAEVPVINALSSFWHPTQVLADLLTLSERRSLRQDRRTFSPSPHSLPYSSPSPSSTTFQEPASDASGQSTPGVPEQKTPNAVAAKHRTSSVSRYLRPLTIAYVGDSANVLHDMLVTYPRLGHRLQIASPPNPRYRAPAAVWDRVLELECDKAITWTADPREAVQGADVVVTDTWVSMGQEAEYAERVKDFEGYQVTEEMCKGAKRDWKFLHCLPRKSHEVDDEVFYGPRSLVFHEADNRKWTIMALFHVMFGGGSYGALPRGKPAALYGPAHKGNKGTKDNKTQPNKSVGLDGSVQEKGAGSVKAETATVETVETAEKSEKSVTAGELFDAVRREAKAALEEFEAKVQASAPTPTSTPTSTSTPAPAPSAAPTPTPTPTPASEEEENKS